MQSRDESGEHRGPTSYKNGRGKCFTKVDRHLRETRSVWCNTAENSFCCAFNKQSRIVSAILLSSTSPPSKSNSEPRSRIHPGIMRVPRPVPVCCEVGGVTFRCKSVAVEWRIYKFASACSWFPLKRPGKGCEGTTEKSEEVGSVVLARSPETREKSDSEGALSLGGRSRSI